MNNAGSYFIPTLMLPQGDSTFLLKPGKPVSLLKPSEAAKMAGVSVATIYRLYHDGKITGQRLSPHTIRLHAESVQKLITNSQDPEFALKSTSLCA